MKSLRKLLPANQFILLFVLAVAVFYYQFIFWGKIPIPSDTIVGMYHPWRDKVWDGLTSGVPFKNFLITDPVRQQYVWRILSIEQLRKGNLPLWNPYAFSGMPLLANFQSAAFYPLNILFFILPFNLGWGILVLLQTLLAGLFMFLYLRQINLSKTGSFLGAITFSFSGFSIAWLEWNTIIHTALWLPLILLSIEKIILYYRENLIPTLRRDKIKNLFFWLFLFTFSLVSSFFAGHLQTFFYSIIVGILYILLKVCSLKKNKIKLILLFAFCFLLFALVTSIQWLPTLQFIQLSARDIDQASWQKEGWFIPWQNLIQFIAPDFFGNPATLNYWGIWNYAEFIGYIGILPLIFALYAIFFRQDKKILFFSVLTIISLIMALPTPLARLPFIWQIPFLSSSQPTRLMFIVDFSLSILVALGVDKLIQDRSLKKVIIIFLFLGLLLVLLWLILFNPALFRISVPSNFLYIAKRNLILPSIVLFMSMLLLLLLIKDKSKKISKLIIYLIVVFVIVDLFRFGWKFTPFSHSNWIFPQTKLLSKLISEARVHRVMAVDRRILPPNFSVFYKLLDVSGYDPLYLKNYGQFVSSWENNAPSYGSASFNRIITPQYYDSFITDLIGVKYILSLGPLKSDKLLFLEKEGDTYLYENISAYPRIYFVEKIENVQNEDEEIQKLFLLRDELRKAAIVSEDLGLSFQLLSDDEFAEVIKYDENLIVIKTKSLVRRLLVLTDTYYPSWRVWIDDKKDKIYRTNFLFRGVVVPSGEHTVRFEAGLL